MTVTLAESGLYVGPVLRLVDLEIGISYHPALHPNDARASGSFVGCLRKILINKGQLVRWDLIPRASAADFGINSKRYNGLDRMAKEDLYG